MRVSCLRKCSVYLLRRCIPIVTTVLFCAVSVSVAETIQRCTDANIQAVSMDDGWGLMDADGRILTGQRYCGGGEYSDGLVPFERCSGSLKKQFVYVDGIGNERLTIDALQVGSFSEGLAPVQAESGKWGYIDRSAHFRIAAMFETAEPFSEGSAAVQIDDEWQYIDGRGNVLFKLRFDNWKVMAAYGFEQGAALVILFDEKRNTYLKGVLDRSYRWLFEPTPNLAGGFRERLAPMWEASSGKLGFVDQNGHFAIPPQFSYFSEYPFQEGLAAVYKGVAAERKAGFVDEFGQWALSPRFEEALHFCGGLAAVKESGKWGFVDAHGQFVIMPQYDEADSFSGGIAAVLKKDKAGVLKKMLINKNGKILYYSSNPAGIIPVS